MASKKHTHKYLRQQIAAGKLFRCALPDCNHFMPKHLEGMIIGRKSICWECGEEFVMVSSHLEQDMPTCNSCKLADKVNPDLLDAIRKLG